MILKKCWTPFTQYWHQTWPMRLMTTLSSLEAPQVVVMTTCDTSHHANNDGIMLPDVSDCCVPSSTVTTRHVKAMDIWMVQDLALSYRFDYHWYISCLLILIKRARNRTFSETIQSLTDWSGTNISFCSCQSWWHRVTSHDATWVSCIGTGLIENPLRATRI